MNRFFGHLHTITKHRMHHKGRNRHHYEYWTDYSIVLKKSVPMKMPLVYVIEMFCDRVAACKVYLKDRYTDSSALEYYNRRLGQEEMHEETSALLGTLVKMLAEKGEKETFRYIRRELRKQQTAATIAMQTQTMNVTFHPNVSASLAMP